MTRDETRRADAYQKIQLGGLVKKSGMAVHEVAVILGALVDALERAKSDTERARFKRLGDQVFALGQGARGAS